MSNATAKTTTVLDPSAQQLAEQYASALADLLATPDRIAQAIEALTQLNDLLNSTPSAWDLLTEPTLSPLQRTQLSKRLFNETTDSPLRELLGVLSANDRLELLRYLPAALHEQANRLNEAVDVFVTTASPMSESAAADLKAQLADALNIHPALHISIDPSLIAGLQVRIGDSIYDASTRAKLQRLTETISKRTFQTNTTPPPDDEDETL